VLKHDARPAAGDGDVPVHLARPSVVRYLSNHSGVMSWQRRRDRRSGREVPAPSPPVHQGAIEAAPNADPAAEARHGPRGIPGERRARSTRRRAAVFPTRLPAAQEICKPEPRAEAARRRQAPGGLTLRPPAPGRGDGIRPAATEQVPYRQDQATGQQDKRTGRGCESGRLAPGSYVSG